MPSKPCQISNIVFSRVLPNQEINLREEKVVQMYYLVCSVNLRNVGFTSIKTLKRDRLT